MDWSTEGITSPTAHHKLFSGFRPDGIAQRALDLYGERVDRDALPREEIPPYLVTLARGGLAPKGSWTFGTDDYATSPCFVPRTPDPSTRPTYDPTDPGRPSYTPANPGGFDGWVVVPVLNDDGFRVEVFDAAGVGDGPVATLAAPGGATVPFLIHSAWMPVAKPAPDVERLRFADDVAPDALATLPEDLRAAVHDVATRLG
jgi:all-trans-8'-apo-beta-carotenal 15,15'-oxygenase